MFDILDSVPLAQEFVELRTKAGLSAKSLKAAQVGLPNSLYGVSVYVGEKLIGMGRVVGDGGCNFEIVDVAVDPQYQGKGIGRVIMEKIDGYLSGVVMEGSYVSMIADQPEFYSALGYRMTTPSVGMTKRFVPVG